MMLISHAEMLFRHEMKVFGLETVIDEQYPDVVDGSTFKVIPPTVEESSFHQQYFTGKKVFLMLKKDTTEVLE